MVGNGGIGTSQEEPSLGLFRKHQTCFLVIDDSQLCTDRVDLSPVGLFLCVYMLSTDLLVGLLVCAIFAIFSLDLFLRCPCVF
jgi:hypothetical protein